MNRIIGELPQFNMAFTSLNKIKPKIMYIIASPIHFLEIFRRNIETMMLNEGRTKMKIDNGSDVKKTAKSIGVNNNMDKTLYTLLILIVLCRLVLIKTT